LPLYEYECAKDGTFEQIQKFSDPPLAACPTCGGPVERLLSAPAIQFKGTGWYITDYARKSTGGDAAGKKDGGSADKGSSDAPQAGPSGSSSSDSKPTSSSTSGDKK
jgi:putative FmdB family regulatory protein